MSATEAGTVVVGAGAAGLQAAVDLAAAGEDVLLLEARERIGGRILGTAVAGRHVELGAEFVHGRSPAVFDWLRRTGDAPVDAGMERWMLEQGRLRPSAPLFDALRTRLRRIERPRSDLPFATFLDRHRRALGPAMRRLATSLVQGFDAADAQRVSAREVLEEWEGGAAADAPTFRPGRGFSALVEGMRLALPPDRVRLWCGTVVQTLRWRRGRVTLEATRFGEPVRVEAPRALVTVPLGVLQQPDGAPGALRFEPPLASKRAALARLKAGPVLKLVLHFARPFWETVDDGRLCNAAFFFAPEAPFPTFWTGLPVRHATLTAWSAGPAAAALAGRDGAALLDPALASLASIFGRRRALAQALEACAVHDWQADPCARGAYGYVLARGRGARKALAEPVEDTLFFAGEACDVEGEAGTVGGALNAGRRAARRMLAGPGSDRG